MKGNANELYFPPQDSAVDAGPHQQSSGEDGPWKVSACVCRGFRNPLFSRLIHRRIPFLPWTIFHLGKTEVRLRVSVSSFLWWKMFQLVGEVVLLEHLLMHNELLGLQNSLVFLHPWRSLGCFPSVSRAVTLHCIRSYESCFRSS